MAGAVSLQEFVKYVAGRTYRDIVARFGPPSCSGGELAVYENFVKDERTGVILSAYITFAKRFPKGTVTRRGGKKIVSVSDMRYLAVDIVFPEYYQFEVEKNEDWVIQNIRQLSRKPGRIDTLGGFPSCKMIRANPSRNAMVEEELEKISKPEDQKSQSPNSTSERVIEKKEEPRLKSPTIVSSPPSSMEGSTYIYQVKAKHPDNLPTVFILRRAPKGMEIDKNTGLIRWKITKEGRGTHLIEIEASDNKGASSIQRYTLVVQ
jgi:hypothetical protein